MKLEGASGQQQATALRKNSSLWKVASLAEVAKECRSRNNGQLDDKLLCGVLKSRGLVPMRERVKGDSTDRCKVVAPNAFAYNPMRLNIGSIARNTADNSVMVSPDYVVFQTDPGRLLPNYLDHIRHSGLWRSYVGATGDGSVRVRIYFDQLSRYQLPLPPLPEQHKIAAFLTAVDDKLDIISRQIDATQALKQGLMQILFSQGVGTQDATGRWIPHTKFKDSELGEIPEGWLITTLGEICSGALQTGPFGSQLHAAEYQDEGVPVLMPKDLSKCRANLSTAARIAPERAEELAKHKLAAGDLLFSRRGDVARFALIDEQSAGALCGTGCLKAKPSEGYSSAYIAHLLQLDVVRAWLEQNAVGQTMPNMNTGILASLPLIAPAKKQEQEEIAGILDSVDAKTGLLISKQLHFQTLKRGLMQKLLTGEWRLKLDSPSGTA
jgi:type I restriction enzyme S subunit